MRFLPLLLLAGCGIEGLHNANPKTVIRIDPLSREMYLSNNKDVDLQIDGLDIDLGAKRAKLDKLVLTDKASSVREANVLQMQGMALQATANWQGATQFTGAVFSGLAEIVPYLPPSIAANALGKMRGSSVSTPWGSYSQPGLSDAQVQALLALTATRPAP